jgi:hypothetical protein
MLQRSSSRSGLLVAKEMLEDKLSDGCKVCARFWLTACPEVFLPGLLQHCPKQQQPDKALRCIACETSSCQPWNHCMAAGHAWGQQGLHSCLSQCLWAGKGLLLVIALLCAGCHDRV